KYDEQEMDTLSKIIGEGIERNEFKMMDATLTAKIIVIAMKGLEVPLMLENEKNDIKNRISEVLDILFYGMCR
ncbi:MAG: TetR/AcrR family transcriptional regulator, partial [Bacteroidia bacterium]|nr:TetR/AcrR family transcriptional regulator [Bacteroidia bacterium]